MELNVRHTGNHLPSSGEPGAFQTSLINTQMTHQSSQRLGNSKASEVAQRSKIWLPVQETKETRVQSLHWEDSLEEETATHFCSLAWKIPWAEEHGRLQPTGLQRIRQD